MPFDCQRCRKPIEFSGERPSFCPYCGVALSSVTQIQRPNDATHEYVPGDDDPTEAYFGAAPGTDGVPASIGGYRLVRLLGAGGMGAVYEGVSEDSGQRVAVKLLHTLAKSSASAIDRFRQEGLLASQLAHPHCVFVLRADEEAGKPYIVMELMPGETLRDAVRQRGPLPSDEAVAKILDVIDGLIEAHRLNILHRDVKPSNCFVMADGRVKVGDFGLSKSLSADVNLTQTGSFLGTVLYAPPEQIRGESLDYSADVYSVSATLYFLLAGRAPFQHENPAVVISRVISETPPDITLLRPDLPRRLQKVVMRGLDREPVKRFQSLEELRAALADIVSRPLNRSSLGARAAAYFIDLMILMPMWLSLTVIEVWMNGHDSPIWIVPKFFYFALCEYAFGATFGKWVLRLRVADAVTGGPPRFRQLALRTGIFVVLTFGAGMAIESYFERSGKLAAELGLLGYVGGWLVLIATMRGQNGFRGLHEMLSGTRVVQLPWPRRVRRIVPPIVSTQVLEMIPPELSLPAQFGTFVPAGILEQRDGMFRLRVADATLRRDVHLIVRREPATPTSEARKTLARPTRTRWIGGGATNGWNWDAYLAPAGVPMTDIVDPEHKLGWPETLAILEQITDELIASGADGTLAGPIASAQVYVRPDGRVTLLNPLGDHALIEDEGLKLLRDVAVLALEGRPRAASERLQHINAVIPLHAAKMLDRLLEIADPLDTVPAMRTTLRELETRPAETATPQRILSLGFLGLALALPLTYFFLLSGLFIAIILWSAESRFEATSRICSLLDTEPTFVIQHVPALADESTRNRVFSWYAESSSLSQSDIATLRPGLNLGERMLRKLISFSDQSTSESRNSRRDEDIEEIRAASRIDSGEPIAGKSPGSVRGLAYWLVYVYCVIAAVFTVGVVVWSAVSRGGWSLAFAGLALVRNDGRRAARWQCVLRAVVIFVAPLALLCACVVVKAFQPQWLFLHSLLWWMALLWLAGFAVIGLMRPGRGPQDRLTGLHVVPR